MKKKVMVMVMAAAMAAMMTLAGCGSKTAETTGSEASSDAAGGTLVMATNAEFPPYEYRLTCQCPSSRMEFFPPDPQSRYSCR